ncbi:hypothetical protein [Rhodococcus sp. WAY2]|uniref:hypothetical protein n=1 Tax=Rhodococcus sp. WAY2 TaxID=2663121 RepID=UPI001F2781E0|nr:hypothetical protein [Rhodococcus sp. WAY2]
MGANRSQTSRWVSGKERPGPAAAPRLIDLGHVLARARLGWGKLQPGEPECVSRRGTPGRRDQVVGHGVGPGGAYRVFPYLPSPKPGQPGHPLYEHRPPRGGHIDHPDFYAWYLSQLAEAACGETFGNLAHWEQSMFGFPQLPGSHRALGTFRLPDDLRVLDLDDPAQLVRLSLRATHIVIRNLAVTQG